jgi:hypothetical protein
MDADEMLGLFEAHRKAEAARDIDAILETSFAVPFANVVPFEQGLMAGERIYFDLATLCAQARIPLEEIRAAAALAATQPG